MNKSTLLKARYSTEFLNKIVYDTATPLTVVRKMEEAIGKDASRHLWNCVYGYEKGGTSQGFIPVTESAETALQCFEHIGEFKVMYPDLEGFKKEKPNHTKAIRELVEEADDVDYNFLSKLSNYLKSQGIIGEF